MLKQSSSSNYLTRLSELMQVCSNDCVSLNNTYKNNDGVESSQDRPKQNNKSINNWLNRTRRTHSKQNLKADSNNRKQQGADDEKVENLNSKLQFNYKNIVVSIKNANQKCGFQCIKCNAGKNWQKCQICNNEGKIYGKSNIVNFICYMIEFKSGQKNCYKAKNQPEILVSSKQPVSLKQMLKKSTQTRDTHFGYACDKCGANPIKGIRYHCKQSACNDDFDICCGCYLEHGHIHEMQQFTYNAVYSNLRMLSSKDMIKKSRGFAK